MGRAIEILTELSAEELRVLVRKEDDRRAAMRMLAIANELDGYERAEAAQLAGMSDQALRDAIKRCNAEGLDGLHDRRRPGRPRRLTAEQEAEVKAAVLAGPDIAGLLARVQPSRVHLASTSRSATSRTACMTTTRPSSMRLAKPGTSSPPKPAASPHCAAIRG
jgi:hypothetical protein